MSFFCFGGRWLWIRKVALRNVPVARFNHRGLPVGRQPLKYLMVVPATKRIHHRTGRQACSSAVIGLHQTIARAQSEGKNRLFGSEINLYRLFGTIYCRLRRYPVGAHSVRPGSAKSYGAWANTPTRSEPPAAVARWTPTTVGVFASTVQPVQMNLQTVCRGRTPGHLLLRLCRNSPWHTLRDRLYRPKNIFSELTTHGQFFI